MPYHTGFWQLADLYTLCDVPTNCSIDVEAVDNPYILVESVQALMPKYSPKFIDATVYDTDGTFLMK